MNPARAPTTLPRQLRRAVHRLAWRLAHTEAAAAEQRHRERLHAAALDLWCAGRSLPDVLRELGADE